MRDVRVVAREPLDGRIKGLGLAVLVAMLALIGRLWVLQVMRGDVYARMADGNRIRVIPIAAPRGDIYDRYGRPLATNRFAYTLSVVPMELGPDRDRVLRTLAEILHLSLEEIEATLAAATRPYEPVRLKRDVPPQTVVALEERRLDLPGVLVEPEPVRYYRYGPVAGHLLGYLGMVTREDLLRDPSYRPTDLIGKTGIERMYEGVLRGRDGRREVEVDALGHAIQLLGVKEAVPGRDVYLTIDLDLQLAAERALAEMLQKVRKQRSPKAPGGAVVVMDVRTGEVLALVSQPAFDPNRLLGEERGRYFRQLMQDRRRPFVNRALQAYPPGSTFKPITGVAALETGGLRPDEVYNATGRGPFGKLDWSLTSDPPQPPAGRVTIVGALMRSANDFFWAVSLRPQVGIENIARYARLFGVGEKTGIRLIPGEATGLMPDPQWKRNRFRSLAPAEREWYKSETADVAIGQGFVLMTPIQLAMVYAAIATEGLQYRPILLKQADDPSGQVTAERPQLVRRIELADSTWKAIREGLEAVVQNPRGTAAGAFAGFTVPVAGKTGTAQVSSGPSHGWFASYAPAAPVARRIYEVYFAKHPYRTPQSQAKAPRATTPARR